MEYLNNIDFKNLKFNSNGIAKYPFSSFVSENKIIDKNKIKIWPTLTAIGAHSNLKILENNKIRILTGKEMLEIQGFKLQKNMDNISNYRLKFLAGNSISLFALKEHFKNIEPKTIGVAFAGIDAIGEYFGREKIIDYIENNPTVIKAVNTIYETKHKVIDILEKTHMQGELLHFSPPCQNFSTQGKNSKIDQYSNKIIEIIKNSKPKYISIENVKGYLNIMNIIKEELKDIYDIKIREIIPQNQNRKRLFLLGIKMV